MSIDVTVVATGITFMSIGITFISTDIAFDYGSGICLQASHTWL